MKDKRRALIAALLFSVVVVNYIDRIALAVAAKPIATEFGLSSVAMGYLFSCFLWAYVPALIPLGVLLDRIGSKRMVGGGVAIWSAATAAVAATGGFVSLLIARLVMGASEATVFPTIGRVVRDWVPQRERGLFTTLANCGSSAGPAIGALLTGVLVAALGWRWAFIILGGLGFVWLVVWVWLFDQPEHASWLSPAERNLILSQRDGTAAPRARRPPSSIGHLLRQRSVIGVMSTQACLVYTTYLFTSWLPSYLQSRFGLSVAGAGLFTALPYFFTVLLGLTIARISDITLTARAVQSGARRRFIAGMIVVSLAILLAPLTTQVWQLVLVLTLVLTGATTASSLNFTMASDLLENPADAGRVTSMVAFGGNSFGIISPIVTGYIIAGTGSYRGAFWAAAALLLCGIGLTLGLTRRSIAAEAGTVPDPLSPTVKEA